MIYDAIIIGSGGAALTCAIGLKEKNKNILIITKSSVTSSQTCQAQGGMNGVMEDKDDSVSLHMEDTIKSAHGLGNEEMISYMCENAKDAIVWLDQLGVPFNRDLNNKIDKRKLGGTSKARAHYSSDYTGLKILQTLFDRVVQLKIPILEDTMLLTLLKEDESICGVSVLDLKTTSVEQYLAKNTIIASGGYGGVYHNFTTNSADTTGDGISVAYRAGAILENMEMIQFHPTALKDKFILISESARGEGGYLVTKDEKRFVDELKPRDVVARAIYEQMANGEEIFLDVRHLGYEKIHHFMPQEYKLALDYLGLQMDKDLIPIIPAVHYTMGGIKVNSSLKTSLNNLYAIGECSSVGVHGANRLGGNSLLEIVVFARKLACELSYENDIEIKEYNEYRKDKMYVQSLFEMDKNDSSKLYQDRNRLGKLLYENVGIFRNEKNLRKMQIYVNDTLAQFKDYTLQDDSKCFNMNLKHHIEFKNMLVCAQRIVEASLLRDESRGAHFRDDYLDESSMAYNILQSTHIGAIKS